MNIVKELRKKKGIQQKELALEIGVSRPTVSEWESNKKDPSGERLKKLAEYFGVDELVILGRGAAHVSPLFVPEDPLIAGKTETQQILERLLTQLGQQPKTAEARIVSGGMDKLPKEQREQILGVVRAMFSKQPDLFEEEKGDEHEP